MARLLPLVPPIVVNLRLGERFDQYIGHGSPWANPYVFSNQSLKQKVRAYETYLRKSLVVDEYLKKELKALSGKRLGCHCKPKECHGDVLVKLFGEFFG